MTGGRPRNRRGLEPPGFLNLGWAPRGSDHVLSIYRESGSRKMVWREVLGTEGLAQNYNVTGLRKRAAGTGNYVAGTFVSAWVSANYFFGLCGVCHLGRMSSCLAKLETRCSRGRSVWARL